MSETKMCGRMAAVDRYLPVVGPCGVDQMEGRTMAFGGAGLRGRRSVAVCAGAFLALVVSQSTVPAQATPVGVEEQAIDCPAAFPASSVSTGLEGRGWTVVTGSTPQPFNVEVLGVLTDGMGAGRDLIMINVSD